MIGETLGSYRIVSSIGQGGMGVVYRAEHTLIGKQVAIKVLLRQMTSDAVLVERFFNEARAAAMLKHPGLVEVFDFGQGGGSAFIVMELLEGESLGARIDRETRLPIATALAIARQVASALHAAHEQNIVHRDLKPANIFLLVDDHAPAGVRTKVLDFGIAKLAGAEERRSVKTKTGSVFGTPRYMAPEQCRNATNVDRRADIYGLGCILHEMLLGVAPFDYDNWGELIAAHIHETPPRPTDLDPQLPAAIEAILMRSLAKKLDDRYPTMVDFAHEIETVFKTLADQRHSALFTPPAGLPIARPVSPTGVATIRDTGSAPVRNAGIAPTLPVTGELSRAPASHRGKPWLAVLGVAAVAAAIAIYAVSTRSSEPRAPLQAARPVEPAVVPAPDAALAIAPPVDAGAAEPARVRLTVDSKPTGADVYRAVDGVKLGKTPFAREYERTDGVVELIVRRTGYREERVSLPTTQDGGTRVKLARAKRGESRKERDKHEPSERGSGSTVLDPYGGN
ncbi:MAG TPA: protein kinase [Kofleriaceae bacterium]